MSADETPDELWRKILEIGINSSSFSYKDLCRISISSRRLRRLSSDDSLWHLLLLIDFPNQNLDSTSSSQSPTKKLLYRTRFEKDKERKLAAHRRALLRKESEISEWCRRIREMEARLSEEAERLQAASMEFSNLQRVRQASVALNVWQPEIVRGRQKQMVEQTAVPVEARSRALEMEIKLCKQQITGVNRALREVRNRFDMAKKELESMKYHPLRDYKFSGEQVSNAKRKKLKTSINFPAKVSAIPRTKDKKLVHSEPE